MVIEPRNNANAANSSAGKASQSRTEGAQASLGQTTTSQEEATSDSVSLSQQGQSLNKVQAAVDSAPAINPAKLEQIRAAMENGSYRVDANAIADKILAQDDLL